jgi:hypothetical protein
MLEIIEAIDLFGVLYLFLNDCILKFPNVFLRLYRFKLMNVHADDLIELNMERYQNLKHLGQPGTIH